MTLDAKTPHKPASAAFALLTILVALKVHDRLGIDSETLLLVVTSAMTLLATAYGYLRKPKAEVTS